MRDTLLGTLGPEIRKSRLALSLEALFGILAVSTLVPGLLRSPTPSLEKLITALSTGFTPLSEQRGPQSMSVSTMPEGRY